MTAPLSPCIAAWTRCASTLVALGMAGCHPAAPDAWRADAAVVDAAPPVADLPCDVAAVLSARCLLCHGDPPAGAPESLVRHDDLSRPSLSDPSRSMAEVSVELMGSSTDPMPPGAAPSVSAEEIQAFESWIAAGLPRGECRAQDPYDTPIRCSRDQEWTLGDWGSEEMRPGAPCIACHLTWGAGFGAAGTVFESAHEPDDCVGGSASGGASVEITDADGLVITLPVNAGGNFFFLDTVSFPYTARVIYEGRVRAMLTPQGDGECNGCHTEAGSNGAPGRVTLP